MNGLDQGFWVFGYGSLMWTPEFEYEDCQKAIVQGYARSFCMWSVHHRGTPEAPGLVLALDQQDDASCAGLAFRVGAGTAVQCLADLRERELVSSAYQERVLPVQIADGRTVEALAYVIDPEHDQHTGGLSLERQAEVIAGATGGRGTNSDYLFNTSAYLEKTGMEDAELTHLSKMVARIIAS